MLGETNISSSCVCAFGTRKVEASIVNNSRLDCNSPEISYSEKTTLAIKSLKTSPELTLVSDPVVFVLYQQPMIPWTHLNIFHEQYPHVELQISGHGFFALEHMTPR